MKLHRIKIYLLFLILCLPCYVFAKPYILGVSIEQITPHQSVLGRKKAFEHFANALSKQLNQTVEVKFLPSMSENAHALESGTIDIAFLKAVPYGQAKKENKKISGLVTIISRNNNEEVTTHSSYIVTLANNNIRKLEDLKNKRIGLVNNSASGSIYPINYLEQNGIDYKTYFSSYHCYKSQYDLLKALKSGKIDAGTTFRSPSSKHNTDMSDLKVIAQIKNIPNPLFAVSANLSENQQQKIKDALINLPKSAFNDLRFEGLQPLEESLYEPVIKLSSNNNICTHHS